MVSKEKPRIRDEQLNMSATAMSSRRSTTPFKERYLGKRTQQPPRERFKPTATNSYGATAATHT